MSFSQYIEGTGLLLLVTYMYHTEISHNQPMPMMLHTDKLKPNFVVSLVSSLRYPGYHDSTYPYNHSEQYWNLIAARLAFVVVFFFVVHSITAMIAWIVPDVPENLKFKMEREKQVIKEKLGVASGDEESEDEEDVTDKTFHAAATTSA